MDQGNMAEELEHLRARVTELEQALRQREEQFQRLSTNLPDIVAEFDRSFRHIYLNPTAEVMTGIPAEQYIGKTLEELDLPSENVVKWNTNLRLVFERGQRHTLEFSYPTPDGLRHFHSLMVPAFAEDGSVEFVFAFTRDITERKEAETSLLESENKYRTLFNELADFVLVIDRENWQIVDANAAACAILGYSREELLTLNIMDITAEPEKTTAAMMTNLLHVPLRYLRKKGGMTFPVQIRNSEFVLKGKRYLMGAARDISETLEWQDRLRAERDLLEQLMTTSPTSIVRVNRDGQITFANVQAERLFNLGHEEIVRRTYNAPNWHITDDEGNPIPEEKLPFAQIRDTQQTIYGIRHAIHRADGQQILLSINGAPLFDAEHQFAGAVFSMMDVTAQVQAEQALRVREQHYRQLFEELPSGFALHQIICDEANNPVDYVFLQANPAFEKLTGLSAEQIQGRRAREVLPQLEPYWVEQYGRVALGGEPMHFENYNEDTGKHYEVHTFSPEPGQFAVIFSDITDRKRDEATLGRYMQRLQVLYEIDHAILRAESAEEIASASLRHLRVLIPTMQASVVVFDFEAGHSIVLAKGEIFKTVLPDPAWVDQLTPGDPLIVPDVLALPSLPPALETGVRAYVNIPMLAYGKLVGSLNLTSNQPQSLESEQIEVALEVASQIAIAIQQVRLQAEVQRHANELEHRVAERTAALKSANERLRAFARAKDDFVANVSHELRNPITSLKLREHLLLSHPEDLAQHVEVLRRDTTRLERLIEDLLLLSRVDQGRQVSKVEPVDLNQLVARYASDRLVLVQARNLTLHLNLQAQLPLVQADFGLVEQALGILLTNAINYTPGEGQVTISTSVQENSEQTLAGFSVTDTGPGIAPEDLPFLFARFFRGTAAQESGTAGTGLGLAIAKEIIDLHHGSIVVENGFGQGATFRVWLPLTPPEPEL